MFKEMNNKERNNKYFRGIIICPLYIFFIKEKIFKGNILINIYC